MAATDDFKKRTVYVKANFLKVVDINTIKEEFVADVFLQLRWREPVLDSSKDVAPDFSKYWDPKIVISNSGPSLSLSKWKRLKHDKDGKAFIVLKMRIKGTLLENLELHEFPFDIQDLSVVVSTEHSDDVIAIEEDNEEVSAVNVQCFSDETEWLVRDFVYCEPRTISKEYTESTFRNPALQVKCVASRRANFFMYNIVLIMTMISTLSFTTFSVKRSLTPNRLQLMFIITLTGVTFKMVTNASLPKIPYLTHLDRYIIGNMVFTWLVCVWHGVISLFDYDTDLQGRMDLWAFIVFIIVYALFQITFYSVVLVTRLRRSYEIDTKKEAYMEKANSLMGSSWATDRRNRRRALHKRNTIFNL